MDLARRTWREDTQADVGMALASALVVFEPQGRLEAWTAMVTVAEINWRCGNQGVPRGDVAEAGVVTPTTA